MLCKATWDYGCDMCAIEIKLLLLLLLLLLHLVIYWFWRWPLLNQKLHCKCTNYAHNRHQWVRTNISRHFVFIFGHFRFLAAILEKHTIFRSAILDRKYWRRMMKFNPIPGIEYCFLNAKFKKKIIANLRPWQCYLFFDNMAAVTSYYQPNRSKLIYT